MNNVGQPCPPRAIADGRPTLHTVRAFCRSKSSGSGDGTRRDCAWRAKAGSTGETFDYLGLALYGRLRCSQSTVCLTCSARRSWPRCVRATGYSTWERAARSTAFSRPAQEPTYWRSTLTPRPCGRSGTTPVATGSPTGWRSGSATSSARSTRRQMIRLTSCCSIRPSAGFSRATYSRWRRQTPITGRSLGLWTRRAYTCQTVEGCSCSSAVLATSAICNA